MNPFQIQLGLQSPNFYAIIFTVLLIILPIFIIVIFIKSIRRWYLMDFRLNNGKPKVTVIQRFDHLVILLGPEAGKKRKFDNLENMKHFIQRKGYEINVSHLHPGQNEENKS